MENQADTNGTVLAKIAGIWAMVGVTSWSEAASFAAFVLTMYMLARNIWKDFIRPFCERRGWLAVKVASDGN
ncbi:hypothetical protein RSW49_22620 [Escherichia coli]|uniref:hypothetical protein n=1 Tax=Enterobacteriaceae TaxID=543 RepID=UPI001FF3B674|nr:MULTISPECIES: hypothetical protein [Enterobacteriaceae]MDT9046445.1 hypothetical protein [Escherichia coli]MDT9105747.1 hypothetical protein [Escherichia coli]UOV84352.1 hypothetical protein MU320_28960 [Klebsiella pneumoniae]